jgi:Cu2+-exporting ATPase
VDTVLFDKTGTLTVEEPQVAAIHTVPGFTDKAVLRYAAAAEHRQTHPIARAIIKEAAVRNIALPLIDNARYEVGYGIKVSMEEKVICVGSDRFMTLEGVAIPEAIQAQQRVCQAEGHSLVMVAVDQQLAGAIELQPTIRPEAKEIVDELHRRGLTIAIISGDQEGPTRKLAQTLGIEQYFANTLPENKAALVEQLQQAGHAVCFVGDGINDSVALKKANVSVSLRGATTVATDTAQIVLMDQSLQQLRALFTLADEFDVNLKTGFVCAILPAVINIGGIFFWHWGLYASFAVYNLTMLNNLGIATFPLWRHRSNPLRQLDK